MRMGKSPYRAALEAADEIGLAVIAITFTIVAVFAPVSFMGGIAGPVLQAVRPHRRGRGADLAPRRAARSRRCSRPISCGRTSTRRNATASSCAAIRASSAGRSATSSSPSSSASRFFAGSIASTRLLPSGFLPEEDISRSLFVVELPPGARLDDTKQVTDGLAERLREMPEVASVFVNGGVQLPGKKEVRLATLTVNYVPKERTRRCRSGSSRSRIIQDVPRRAGHPLLRPQRERPARASAHRRRTGPGRRHRDGGEARSARWRRSRRSRRALDGAARTGPRSASVRSPRWRPSSASRPT